MANMSLPLGAGFYQSDSLPFANQRCVGLFPNIPQAPALTPDSLFEVQGLIEVANTSRKAADRNRGAWSFNGVPYFINGQQLFKLVRSVLFGGTIAYNPVSVGAIDGTGLCSMSDNGVQLIIINNSGSGFIYQPSTSENASVQPITSNGFTANGTPQQVVYLDGYFIATTNSRKAIISGINDGFSWNALDSITAEADPDNIVAPFVYKNQLYLLGAKTTETFRNIGGAGVPFQRINGFVLTRGCASPFSVIKLGANVFWIGNGSNEQPVALMFSGSEPQKISTTAIDNKLHELSAEQIGQVFSFAYSLRGHDFVSFSSDSWTFIYDVSTGQWHERESQVFANNRKVTKRCRIQSVVSAYNELFAGDAEDGRIGLISETTYTEYDEAMISFFTTSPLYNLGNSFSLPSIELLCESGVGSELERNPEVRLQISRDGVVFEDPRTRMLGSEGNRKIRQVWYRNGRVSRLCIFKVTVSDPVKRRFFGLEIKYKQGVSNA